MENQGPRSSRQKDYLENTFEIFWTFGKWTRQGLTSILRISINNGELGIT